VLIVAPGSLVEQWRDELFEKFGLEFRVFSREMELEQSPSGNPFEDTSHLIVRLDQLSRENEELQEKLCEALRRRWDLVVFDEAHKLSAHFFGEAQEDPSASSSQKLGASRGTCC
jgi:superfamily II DNA or RNA helicase